MPLLLTGCGSDAPEGAAEAASMERRPGEALTRPEDPGLPAGTVAVLSRPDRPGWTRIEPACPFPLRLQVPPGWELDEAEVRSVQLQLLQGGAPAVFLGISMIGGSQAVADRIREMEGSDPSVQRRAEVPYGDLLAPVLGRDGDSLVWAFPAVRDLGAALQQAAVRLEAIWDADGNPLVDSEMLVQLATTLEPNPC